MDKTEMMKKYEKETGEKPRKKVLVMYSTKKYGWGRERNSFFFTNKFVEWLLSQLDKYQAKATTYDRIMSGGRKTLKEWANIFGLPVAMDKNLSGIVFDEIPELLRTVEAWRASHGYVGKIPSCNIYFTGSWQDSLTLPDGWEAKDGHQ